MARRALKKRYGHAKSRGEFAIGRPVEKTMGVRMSGVVIPAFYWRDATDGTYRAPERNDRGVTWVRWTDGTKGWIHNCFLRSL